MWKQSERNKINNKTEYEKIHKNKNTATNYIAESTLNNIRKLRKNYSHTKCIGIIGNFNLNDDMIIFPADTEHSSLDFNKFAHELKLKSFS